MENGIMPYFQEVRRKNDQLIFKQFLNLDAFLNRDRDKKIWYQLLEKKGRDYLILLKQNFEDGYWPDFLTLSWAFVPPISISQNSILISVLVKEEDQFHQLFTFLEKIGSYEIISISNPTENLPYFAQNSPQITARQRAIMTYASTHGYFEIPKKISVYEIAEHFNITPAGVCNHIQKAEKSLMRFHFG
jgi:predicted DNA binding protein